MAGKYIDLSDVKDKDKDNEKKRTYDLLILDESGSTGLVADATIGAFNEKAQSLKKISEEFEDQEYFVSLVTFSDFDRIQDVYWNQPADEVINLTKAHYSPGGLTALFDAVGIYVTKLRDDIKKEFDYLYDSDELGLL